jgi:poly(A) polymerase
MNYLDQIKANIEKGDQFQFLRELKAHHPEIKIYLVGGLVRDALLGRESKDYDFIVENIKPDSLERFLQKHGKIVAESNTRTGVYRFVPRSGLRTRDSGLILDLALPRIEEYKSSSRTPTKIITHDVSLIDDLSRRDFTINAMAVELWSLDSGLRADIVDPFNGQTDLKAGVIRAVGNPTERFSEDPLRILRAVRFACQLGFQFEPKTFEGMTQTKGEIVKQPNVILNEVKDLDPQPSEGGSASGRGFGLPACRQGVPQPMADRGDDTVRVRVSVERIQNELALSLVNPVCFFDLWDKIGLFGLLIPEITALKGIEQPGNWHAEGDAFVHTRLAVEKIPKGASLTVKLATLLHDIGKAATFQSAKETGDRIRFNNHDKVSAEMASDILARLRFDNKTIDSVRWLVKNHMKLILDFPKMRLSKQKALVLNPLFNELMTLTEADARASLRPDGSVDLNFVTNAAKLQKKLQAEIEAGKPVEIINGNQIIKFLKENDIDFDGPLIGKLKTAVNEAYADEKIGTLKEARELLPKLLKKLK